MTWAELTQEQRDIYTTWERAVRAAAGQFQQLLNTFEALNVTYSSQIAGILADLDDNTVVPNTSGLAGSASLDADAETVLLKNDMVAALATFNVTGKKNLRDKAAGLTNTMGTL